MTSIRPERLGADRLGPEKSGPELYAPDRRPSDKQPAPERLGEIDQAAANAFEGDSHSCGAISPRDGSAAMPRPPVIRWPIISMR